MKKKLAILGCSYLQKPLILKATELGIETHCFAWEEGAVCKELVDFFYPISVLDKKEILAKCLEVNIDGIVSIASDIVVPTWSYIATELKLVSNPILVAETCANKYLMRRKLTQGKIDNPSFAVVTNFTKVDLEKLVLGLVYPVIVKPVDRSGSIGVKKVNNYKELKEAIDIALEVSLKKEAIFEEFIEGKEYSVESISSKGKHQILTITEKVTTGVPYFVELEHHQPANLSAKTSNEIKTYVNSALNVLGIAEGASHSEIIITKENDYKVVEIGARMGGDFIGSHLVKLSTGIDYLSLVINNALGGELTKQIIENTKESGVVFMTGSNQEDLYLNNSKYIIIESISGFVSEHSLRKSSDRLGYLIYQKNKEEKLKLNKIKK